VQNGERTISPYWEKAFFYRGKPFPIGDFFTASSESQ
jgi:hypothetical protein